MDRTNEIPERYWVIRAFLHYSTCYPDLPQPTEILCSICGDLLLTAGDTDKDNTPLLMYKDNPICPKDALNQISDHPITPTYLKWLDEGDRRWWSTWLCNCDGCEPIARTPKGDK